MGGIPNVALWVREAFLERGTIKKSLKSKLGRWQGRLSQASQRQWCKGEHWEMRGSENSYFLGVKHVNATDDVYIKELYWPESFFCRTGIRREEREQLAGWMASLSLAAWGRVAQFFPKNSVSSLESLQGTWVRRPSVYTGIVQQSRWDWGWVEGRWTGTDLKLIWILNLVPPNPTLH